MKAKTPLREQMKNLKAKDYVRKWKQLQLERELLEMKRIGAGKIDVGKA